MPAIDKKQEFYRFEINGTVTITKSTSGGYQVSATAAARTQWCPDWLNIVDGIAVYFTGAEGTGPAPAGSTITLSIPLLGVSIPVTLHASQLIGCTFSIQIDALRCFSMNGGGWRIKWDELRFYVDGGLQHTEGATTLDNYFYFAPTGIPLFGVPWQRNATGGLNPQPIMGSVPHGTTPTSLHVHSKCVLDTGVRFKETSGGAWQDIACLVDLIEPTAVPCDCAAPDWLTLDADSIGNTSVEGEMELTATTVLRDPDPTICDECTNGPAAPPFYFHIYDSTLEFTGGGTGVITIPNMAAGVGRINSNGYRAMVYRGGMPKTTQVATMTCGYIDPDTSSRQVEYHPRQAEVLSCVGNSAHAIEDTFSYQVPSPATKTVFRYLASGVDAVPFGPPGGCPLVDPEDPPGTMVPCFDASDSVCYVSKTTEFGGLIDDLYDNPYLMGYLYHDDPIARYVNYWASRHWSYFYWFPANNIDVDGDGDADAQDTWKVFLDNISVSYWLMDGQQWMFHSALPVGEQRQTRNILMSAPLLFGGMAGFIEGFAMGTSTSWWGDETFRIDLSTPETSVATDDSMGSLFTGVDCTVSMDPTRIRLTPNPGESTIQLVFNMSQFDIAPCLYPQFAQQITLAWDVANVGNVLVELAGISGSRVTVTDNVQGTFDKPYANDNKFAGSYSQRFGQFIIDDEGFDVHADGISSSVMADPEAVHAFQLLAGRSALTLEWTIEVIDDMVDVELEYPVFLAPSVTGHAFPENRSQFSVIWPDGPAIRFGNVAHFFNGTRTATPEILPPGWTPVGWKVSAFALGWKPSVVDWVAFRNLMLRGKTISTDFVTGCREFFDSEEAPGLSEGDLTTFSAADDYSIALLNPNSGTLFPNAIIVNGSSCPPVCVFPRRGRASNLWPSGDWAQQTWSYAEERRFYVANSSPKHLYRAGTNELWTQLYSLPIAGYAPTFHLHAVDNNEDYFDIRAGSTVIGRERPWQGAMIIRKKDGAANIPGRSPDVLHNSDGYGWSALLEFDDELSHDWLVVKRHHGQPSGGYETRTLVADGDFASLPCLLYYPFGRLLCFYSYTSGGTTFRYKASDDDGDTFGSEVNLMAGFYGRAVTNDDSEVLALTMDANSSPTAITRKFRGQADDTFGSGANIVDESGAVLSFESESFGLSWDPGLGAWSLFAKKEGEDTPVHFFSLDDGDSWKEV